jgi:phosphohistidine phosphatase
MLKLILVRHAKTEPLTDAGSDFQRKLKKRGWRDARLVAETLQKSGCRPDKIIASPAARAWQTATVFASVFNFKEEDIVSARFLYDGDTTAGMLDELAELAGKAQTLLVVGHNPDMAMLTMHLSNVRPERFPTTASAVISFSLSDWHDINVNTGRLESLLIPKKLKETNDDLD